MEYINGMEYNYFIHNKEEKITIIVKTQHDNNNFYYHNSHKNIFSFDKLQYNKFELMKFFIYIGFYDEFNELESTELESTELESTEVEFNKLESTELEFNKLEFNKLEFNKLDLVKFIIYYSIGKNWELFYKYVSKLSNENMMNIKDGKSLLYVLLQSTLYASEYTKLSESIIFILKLNPSLINDECYEIIRLTKKKKLFKILNTYIISQNDVTSCYLCLLHSEKKWLITNICSCKMYIHFHCIQKLISKNGNSCSICKNKYIKNVPHFNHSNELDKQIYFPHLGIYPIPLLCGIYEIIDKSDIYKNIIGAITYLQVTELKILLTSENKLMLFNKLNNQKVAFYATIKNNKIKLLNNLGSNLCRDNNKKVFDEIEELLNK